MNLLFILLNVYFVSFTDKIGSTSPALSPTALSMREAHNIEIDDLDYPVSTDYINAIQAAGATVLHTSRWFNGATVETDDSTVIQAIRTLSYVSSATMTRDKTIPAGISQRKLAKRTVAGEPSYYQQQAIYNLHPLHQLQGQGLRIRL